MIVKRHRSNNNFQLAYFIAGSCYTADAAYIALLNQRDDREQAVATARADARRRAAKRLRIAPRLQAEDPAERLEAQADLLELDAMEPLTADLLRAAEAELDFINLCIQRVQPLRKYGHLSDAEAAEACQREEFLMEFKNRIENYMITSGQIPANEFASMRQHPDFDRLLLPHITQVQQALMQPGGAQDLLPAATRGFDLPRLLGYEDAT